METMAHLVRNLPFSKDVIFHCPMFEYCIKSTTESKSLKNSDFRGKSARNQPDMIQMGHFSIANSQLPRGYLYISPPSVWRQAIQVVEEAAEHLGKL